jgi:hypothetical protein
MRGGDAWFVDQLRARKTKDGLAYSIVTVATAQASETTPQGQK